MTLELHKGAPSFQDVARLIAQEEGDIDWLADGLRSWIWPQERWPSRARRFGSGLGMFADMRRVRWSRAQLTKLLTKTLPTAANTINEMLGDWAVVRFLSAESLGLGFGPREQVMLVTLLREMCEFRFIPATYSDK